MEEVKEEEAEAPKENPWDHANDASNPGLSCWDVSAHNCHTRPKHLVVTPLMDFWTSELEMLLFLQHEFHAAASFSHPG